jgi:putative tryptophan/tyrosine transport system substrate-binding protein
MGDRMKRRDFLGLVGAAIVCLGAAIAQQPTRVWRIGILHGVPKEASIGVAGFRQRLSELGYVEGQNSVIEYRWSDQIDDLPSLAAALIETKVDVIVAGAGSSAMAAKQATREIPIVVAVNDDDPVASGLVSSLGQPGGNVTGLAIFAPEMSGKRLELLRDLMPHLARVGILWTRQSASHPALLAAAKEAAHRLGIDPVEVEVASPNDIENAIERLVRERVGAVAALQGIEFYRIRARIAELGLKHRMPIVTGEVEFARLGGLLQYGPNTTETWRQAAHYVDKVLKGNKPADLPVGQPTRFDLVINLKTAKVLGLSVPATLLTRADEIIE